MNKLYKKQIEALKDKFNILYEEQTQNQNAIQKIKQIEEDFFELKKHSRQLFDNLLVTWYNDRDLRSFFHSAYDDLQQIGRKVTCEIEEQREKLLKEKHNLIYLENELQHQRQKVELEVKL